MQNVRAITLLADGRLAVGTVSNLYLSDPLRSMFQVSLANRNITSIREINSTLVATAIDGLVYSTDRGGTWTAVPGAEITFTAH